MNAPEQHAVLAAADAYAQAAAAADGSVASWEAVTAARAALCAAVGIDPTRTVPPVLEVRATR